MESLVVAFLIAAGARLAGLALNNLAAANALWVPALYALPLAMMVFAYSIIKGGDRQRTGLALVDKVVAAVANAMQPIIARFTRRREGAATP